MDQMVTGGLPAFMDAAAGGGARGGCWTGSGGEGGEGPGGRGAHPEREGAHGEAGGGTAARGWCPAVATRGEEDRDGGVGIEHPRLDSLAGEEEDGGAHLVVASALPGAVGGGVKLDGDAAMAAAAAVSG